MEGVGLERQAFLWFGNLNLHMGTVKNKKGASFDRRPFLIIGSRWPGQVLA
jgi:hypothetical protein